MSKMSLELSDGLSALRRKFVEFDQEGIALDGEQVRLVTAALKELLVLARNLENEVSRHRWNEAAIADRKRLAAETSQIIAEASRPGTNLRLLSRMSMPLGDGAAQ